jgi:catechol 2,3-dioxygenase-like lactoylglutathione lyase family enzyme
MYVPDVVATVEFYERVFGLKRRFIDGAQYAEMETGVRHWVLLQRRSPRRMGLFSDGICLMKRLLESRSVL